VQIVYCSLRASLLENSEQHSGTSTFPSLFFNETELQIKPESVLQLSFYVIGIHVLSFSLNFELSVFYFNPTPYESPFR